MVRGTEYFRHIRSGRTGNRGDRLCRDSTHGDYRKVRSLKQSMTSSDPKSRPTTQPDNDARSSSRSRRCEVAGRLLSAKKVMRIGTWNVRTLRGLGKSEQLAMEMERNGLMVLGVTETHLPGTGVQTLHENKEYIMLFSGRGDGGMSEGVGLAIAPEARSALRSWRPITSRLLVAEFLTRMGPLAIVVAYGPTENSVSEEKEHFIADLEEVMRRINGLVIVMGDFNARIGRQLKGVVGPHGLASDNSDNGDRLVAFASSHDMTITNTMFPHRRIHQASWYPPNARAAPSMKDFILVKRRLNPSVLDTRVYRGADIDSDHRLVVCKSEVKVEEDMKRNEAHQCGNA